jgi:hypothetical protein
MMTPSRFTFHASRLTLHASRFTFALALVTLLLAAGWTPAPQEGEVAVVGQVTNGTPDGALPVDQPVVLHVFSGMEEKESYTTTLAADGSFRFDGLAPEEGESFVVRVVYQGVTHSSDVGAFDAGQPELSLPVAIYETTEDPATVLVTQLHIFLTRVGDQLQIGEYYLVSNTGDRTYVGVEDPETGRQATLTFSLPEGAEELSFDDPGLRERYLERGAGFTDTDPVPPGTATVEVLFSYELPYREGLRVERTVDVPVLSVVLVVPEEGLALDGEGIVPAGMLDTEMGPALSYAAGPLAAEESLAFTLIPGSQPASVAPVGRTSPTRNTVWETAVGLVGLAAAVVAIYLLWRPSPPGPLPARARSLVKAIAALDVDFEAGQVVEGAYRRKRKALKQQLHALLRGDGGAGGQRDRGDRGRKRRKR